MAYMEESKYRLGSFEEVKVAIKDENSSKEYAYRVDINSDYFHISM